MVTVGTLILAVGAAFFFGMFFALTLAGMCVVSSRADRHLEGKVEEEEISE